LSLQAGRVGLRFEFVDELIELIEIDAGFEPEGVRGDFRDGPFPGLRFFTETGSQRPVDNLFERQPQFSGPSLQQPSEIIVDSECGAHSKTSWMTQKLMSRHQKSGNNP
jgi:hypothetical protein